MCRYVIWNVPEGRKSKFEDGRSTIHTWILRKDTHNCPFARFLPLGRISCEGPGNGHFLTTVVNFVCRTFWADLTLLCVKMYRFFWAEIPEMVILF